MPPSIFCITKADPLDTGICPEDPTEVNPVPPLLTAMAVALHTPVVIVPIVVRLLKESIAFSKVASVVASILSMFVKVKLPLLSLNGYD